MRPVPDRTGPIMYPMRTTCRRASELMLAAEDRALRWHERLALRLHWRICAACVRFRDQTVLMRQAIGRWKQYAEGDDGPPGRDHGGP